MSAVRRLRAPACAGAPPALIAGHDPARPGRRASAAGSCSPTRCAPAASAASTRPRTRAQRALRGRGRAASSPRWPSRSSPQRLGARGARPGRPHGLRAADLGPARARAAVGPAAGRARRADLVAAARRPERPAGRARSAADAAAVFAPQVPLYGIGHRPHRGAAGPPPLPRGRPLAPLLSSLVVIGAYLGTASIVDGAGRPPSLRQRRGDPGARPGAPRSASSRCRLPLLVPACAPAGAGCGRRCGFPPRTPAGSAPLGGAGISRCSPSRPPSWSTLWLANQRGDVGHAHRLHLRPGRLPAAVRRARRAARHERLPGARRAHAARASDVTAHAAAARLRGACSSLTGLSVGGAHRGGARPSARSSSLLDARAATAPRAARALAALPATLTAFAPGLRRVRRSPPC